MIDICPVGALTSKPFRYSARTWELSRRKSVSPHDATGANLIVQVKNNKVMRVVPLENEDVNECWIADRDRFSYEALESADRLTKPMLKQGGEWKEVDWQTALEYVANGLQGVKAQHGPQAIGTLASPHSTAEELFLAANLTRGLGSQNIDTRLRAADFQTDGKARWLGTSVASLTTLQRALVIGSNIRKDQPLLAHKPTTGRCLWPTPWWQMPPTGYKPWLTSLRPSAPSPVLLHLWRVTPIAQKHKPSPSH
jgi:NADH-quinone oxidoreductase subunit G